MKEIFDWLDEQIQECVGCAVLCDDEDAERKEYMNRAAMFERIREILPSQPIEQAVAVPTLSDAEIMDCVDVGWINPHGAIYSHRIVDFARAVLSIAAPARVDDEQAEFKKWFSSQDGKPYEFMWDFAWAAWQHRAALIPPSPQRVVDESARIVVQALEIVQQARDAIGAGALAQNAQYERQIVEPHLDGIEDELRGLLTITPKGAVNE